MLNDENHIKTEWFSWQDQFWNVPRELSIVLVDDTIEQHLDNAKNATSEVPPDSQDRPTSGGLGLIVEENLRNALQMGMSQFNGDDLMELLG